MRYRNGEKAAWHQREEKGSTRCPVHTEVKDQTDDVRDIGA